MRKHTEDVITAKSKEKAIFEGTAQAFNDWLYNKPITVTDCFQDGIKQAFADWLKETKIEIMEMVKEIVEKELKK